MSVQKTAGFALRTLGLTIVMLVIMVVVSMIAVPMDADASGADGSEGNILPLFIVCAVDALVIALIIKESQWRGLPLVLGLSLGFYGVQTVVGQIEAVAFLTPLGERLGAGSIPQITMPLDFILSQFLVGAAMSGFGVPAGVLIFGKAQAEDGRSRTAGIPQIGFSEWLVKAGIVMIVYVLLYFSFGYFIAWKSPALTEFYQGTDPGSFLLQMEHVLRETPLLIPWQAFRALLWMTFSLPIIRMLQHKPWFGALLTGAALSLPMNIPHIVPNPYMPAAVRTAHFIETASSNFIFGLILFWLLHRSHWSPDSPLRGDG